MADSVLFVNISRVSAKCLFEVWLFKKGVIDDKMAITAMRWTIFRKRDPTSNAKQNLHSIATSVQKISFPYT